MNILCPKCNAKMLGVRIDEIAIDRCTRCGGIWCDLREHDRLRDRAHAERIDLGDPSVGTRKNAVRNIDCPRCCQKMVKLAFHDQPHIDYEQCVHCGGAYLDAGEFTDFVRVTASERFKTWWTRTGVSILKDRRSSLYPTGPRRAPTAYFPQISAPRATGSRPSRTALRYYRPPATAPAPLRPARRSTPPVSAP